MTDYIMGIDPGASGGITVLRNDGSVVESIAMPATRKDLWEAISKYRGTAVAFLEKVGSMPGQGVSSTFKFGNQYGHLQMALTAAEIPYYDVTPGKWQKALGLITRPGETKTEHKNRMKGTAQQFFPGVRVTLKNSDSILIAFYGTIKK